MYSIQPSTKIENLKTKYKELKELKYKNSYIDIDAYYSNVFARVLIISSTSFFETEITQFIRNQIDNSNTQEIMKSFSKKLITDRKYHQWFDFKVNPKKAYEGTYRFLSFFSTELTKKIKIYINSDENEKIKNNLSAFIKIHKRRNTLAHNDFFDSDIGEVTFDDVYKEYENALEGVNFLIEEIQKY